MSVILGINAYHPGASAAIIVDGIPVAAMAEERLNRVKYFAGFPTLAIRQCLEIAGLNLGEVDVVSIGRSPNANLGRKVLYALTHPSKFFNLQKIKYSRSGLESIRQLIATQFDTDPQQLRFTVEFVEHHLAHIASAYFISPWDKSAGISIDGSGDFVSCMMAACEGSDIHVIKRLFVPHSLGTLYTTISEFIGYGKYGDEGKVMGLAPLGKNTFSDLLEDMLYLTPTGFKLNHRYFMPFGSNQRMTINSDGTVAVTRHYSTALTKILGPARTTNSELSDRDRDLAFSLQLRFEQAYLHLLRILHSQISDHRIVMAGGCTLNSVANGKIFTETPFTDTCIQPAAGDDGLALGSALYVSNTILKENQRWVMENGYLGPEHSDSEIQTALNAMNVSHEKLDRTSLLEKTADEIVAGNIVGWFQGRMEWGPRALGNRSILAHPGLKHMRDTLNARIKHREAFRPFAPAVLVEQQSNIFEQNHPSPFMLHVYKIRPEWRDRLSAVNHVDDTGRLQTVSRENNALFYDLINQFAAKTGIPVILNTSFNENEPIVCKPSEAISCFLRTKMDTLVIGPFFCKKND